MINITPFCWRLERNGEDRVRLIIYCVPGWSGRLASQLSRFGARKLHRGAVIVRRVAGVVKLLEHFCEHDARMMELVRAYKESHVGARRRKPIRDYTARVEAVNAMLGPPKGAPPKFEDATPTFTVGENESNG